MFRLQRITGSALALTEQHDLVAAPRKGTIAWEAFEPTAFDRDELERAARLWEARAVQEMHSLALFTELAGHLQVLGAPLDWSGAFARMIADEVRHTDLCLRMCEVLGHPTTPTMDEGTLHLYPGPSRRYQVRHTVLAAFCIGETLSGRMFRQAYKAASVPLAKEVVQTIVVDEGFHAELGWELGALLMRGDDEAIRRERDRLAGELPRLIPHYARLCGALRGPSWARGEPAWEPRNNFGELSIAGYARAFFDGMEEDVLPGLAAIGLPEGEVVYRDWLSSLPG